VLDGDGPSAAALRTIVDRIISDVAPPAPSGDQVDMAGCSARMLAAVAAALDAAD
jgi:hypothetical protein